MDFLASLADHPAFKWVSIASAVVFVLSLAAIPVVIALLPADYFTEKHREEKRTGARLVLAVVRNVLGALLLLAGVAMLVLPGQGVLMILTAIVVMDFPGKKKLECKLARKDAVLRAMNKVRGWARKQPFELEPSAA